MRIDLFLKKNRIIKRRALAKQAVEKGYVLKNGHPTKPGAALKPGDELKVLFSNRFITLKVTEDFGAEIIEEVRR